MRIPASSPPRLLRKNSTSCIPNTRSQLRRKCSRSSHVDYIVASIVNLVGRIGHVDPPEIVERDGQPLALAHGGDHRQEEGDEEERRVDPVRRSESEIDGHDAEEDRDAVGDDDEHPDVAVVAQVDDAADGTAFVGLDPADEQGSLAASRTASPPSATQHLELRGSLPRLRGASMDQYRGGGSVVDGSSTTSSPVMFVWPVPHEEFVQTKMYVPFAEMVLVCSSGVVSSSPMVTTGVPFGSKSWKPCAPDPATLETRNVTWSPCFNGADVVTVNEKSRAVTVTVLE